jgi:hypothetical protein
MGVNILQGHTASIIMVNNRYLARDWNPSPAEYIQKPRWKSRYSDRLQDDLFSIPGRDKTFVCTPLHSDPASYPVDTGGSFPGGKVAGV